MHDPKELWKEVELLQEQMHEIISKKGANSPEAIRVIQMYRNKVQEYNAAIK